MQSLRPTSKNLPLLLAASCAFPLACAQGPTADGEEINVNPASQDEAAASIAAIGRLERANPQDPRALEAIHKMQPRLDELNHVVARLEPTPGHVVKFYESSPGVLGISEVGPEHDAPLLRDQDVKGQSAITIYRKLAAGSEPPTALIQADERERAYRDEPQTGSAAGKTTASTQIDPATVRSTATDSGDIQRVSQALTANDGAFFTSNICFTDGDSRGCFPNWANGGFVDGWTKTSFLKIAPFAGGTVFVRLQYEGSTVDTEPVFQGNIGSFWAHSSKTWDCCGICACGTSHYDVRHHRWDLLQAAGKSFHWTFELKSQSCWDFDCESP